MTRNLRRLLGAAALGGTSFLLWMGTASADPQVEVTGTDVTVEDPTATTPLTIDRSEAPVAGVGLTTSGNDVVVGGPGEEPAFDPPPPPTSPIETSTSTAPADTTLAVDDVGTAAVTAPEATAEPDAEVCGNAVGVAGDASAWCQPGDPSTTLSTSPEPGSASVALEDGTTAEAHAPAVTADPEVVVCGNGAGVLGNADGSCGGGTPAGAPVSPAAPDPAQPGFAEVVLGEGTAAEGTTSSTDLPEATLAPAATVCGNGAGIAGDGSGSCGMGAPAPVTVTPVGTEAVVAEDVPVAGGSGAGASVPVSDVAPSATACGNGAGIAGDGSGSCSGTAPGPSTSTPAEVEVALGEDVPVGPGSGIDASVPVSELTPSVLACGNGAGIVGAGSGSCGTAPAPAAPAIDPTTATATIGGTTPPAGGTTVEAPSTATDPAVTACANGAGIFGSGSGSCTSATGPAEPAGPRDPAEDARGRAVAPAGTGSDPTGPAVLAVAPGTGAGTLLAGLGADGLTRLGPALTGAAAAALAVTGFGIRHLLLLASLLLVLGGLLVLADRRRSPAVSLA